MQSAVFRSVHSSLRLDSAYRLIYLMSSEHSEFNSILHLSWWCVFRIAFRSPVTSDPRSRYILRPVAVYPIKVPGEFFPHPSKPSLLYNEYRVIQ